MATRDARLVHEESEYQVVDVSVNQTTVLDAPGILTGVYVNTVLSAHTVAISDGSTTVVTLVASAAAGTSILYPGLRFDTSIVVNPNASSTGSITLAYRKVNPD